MGELNLFGLEDELRKRPRLRERLEELAEGGDLTAWEIDGLHRGGKRPLLLMVRVKNGSWESYFLVSGQTGKNGAVYQWEHYPDAYGKKEKHPGGRPAKYGPEDAERAKALKAEGLSLRKIADRMGASTFTVRRLLNR